MTRRAPAPWLFALLSLPHAVVIGGVSGTLLSFLLRQQGVAPHAIANQRALLLLPGSLFFLWSPLTDFLLRRKTWLLLSTAASSLTVMLALEMKSYASKSAVTLLWTSSCLILLAYAAIGGLVALLMRPGAEDAGWMFSAGGQPGGRGTLRRWLAVAGGPCQQGNAGRGCGGADLPSGVAGTVVR